MTKTDQNVPNPVHSGKDARQALQTELDQIESLLVERDQMKLRAVTLAAELRLHRRRVATLKRVVGSKVDAPPAPVTPQVRPPNWPEHVTSWYAGDMDDDSFVFIARKLGIEAEAKRLILERWGKPYEG